MNIRFSMRLFLMVSRSGSSIKLSVTTRFAEPADWTGASIRLANLRGIFFTFVSRLLRLRVGPFWFGAYHIIEIGSHLVISNLSFFTMMFKNRYSVKFILFAVVEKDCLLGLLKAGYSVVIFLIDSIVDSIPKINCIALPPSKLRKSTGFL